MSEETIINGIDVSESVLTATNNNIYYSQIVVDELQNNIKRLQEENEKLKEEIKQLEDFIKSDGEIVHINHEYTYKLQKENNELKKLKCKFKEYCTCNIEKYRSALEEIRKIVEPIKENTCFGMNCGAVNWILNEIDEVLNDRD